MQHSTFIYSIYSYFLTSPWYFFNLLKTFLRMKYCIHTETYTHTCCVNSIYSRYTRILYTHNLSTALTQSSVSVGSCHLSSFFHLESVQPASCPVQPCVFCGPALSTCLTSPQYAAEPGCKISLCLTQATHTTVRLSCQDITTSSPDYWCNSITSASPCMPPANWQFTLCQVSPNDTTKLLYLSLFTSKPLTSRLASSMVWLVHVTSSWQLIFSVVALSNWLVRLWRLASRS